MKKKSGSSNNSRVIVKTVALGIGALIMLYPLLFMVARSFRPESMFFADRVPFSALTVENYIQGWNGMKGLNFSVFFQNSIFLVLCCIVANTVSCAITAFPFARLDFRGKNFLFTILMISMMLPFHVVLLPRFIMFKNLDWLDSYLPLIIPKLFATEGFFCYLMVQFMRSIPKALDQAAMIDGCNPIQTFLHVILPLCRSSMTLVATFTLIWTWNDFFSQLIYVSSPKKLTIALGLRTFIDETSTSHYGQMFAMSVVSILPIILFFIFAQRELMEGIHTTGLKG